MADPVASVEAAAKAVASLRSKLRRGTSAQVRSQDERTLIEATAWAWFKTHRLPLEGLKQIDRLDDVDAGFRSLLEFAGRATTREKYDALCKKIRTNLMDLRLHLLAPDAFKEADGGQGDFGQPPPDFSKLVPDPEMQAILNRRWEETKVCLRSNAPLAATVMMGSLLEGLLLARINRMPAAKPAFTANASPKDKQGNPKPLKEWTLYNYIEVGHELGWIRQAGKDVGSVLRDYRNYIHPHKELSHGVMLNADDTSMFWGIFTSLANQVLNSV